MGGQVLGQVCSFVRNVVVARLLTPEDFGIAATFAIAISIFEMISNLAVDRLLVQAEDGDEPDFQATAHAFQVVRGLGLALVLFLLAWPLSRLFSIPQALWAFQCVALVPLIRGFMHLDPKRMQRRFGFGADVLTELIPQVVLMLAAWPFALWFKDFSAMVWLLVFQAMVMVVVSHAVARRRYTLAWNRSFLERMYAFGWPLMYNGLLMCLILQGDRVIIGFAYDMTQLGVYSAAFSIAFVPSMMVGKVASTLLLPLLSKRKGDSHEFSEYYEASVCLLCLIAVAVVTGFIFLGQRVVVLAYGDKYAGVDAFISWLAIMHMLRTVRFAPTTASMALGDTVTPLAANIVRAILLPVGLAVAMAGKPLVWLAILGCASELVSMTVLLIRLDRKHKLRSGLAFKPICVTLVTMGAAYFIAMVTGEASWALSVGMVLFMTTLAFAVMRMFFPSLYHIRRGENLTL